MSLFSSFLSDFDGTNFSEISMIYSRELSITATLPMVPPNLICKLIFLSKFFKIAKIFSANPESMISGPCTTIPTLKISQK